MKFRYYITSLFDGNIQGTNNEKTAIGYAESEDFFVADSEEGLWIQSNGDHIPIEEIGIIEEE